MLRGSLEERQLSRPLWRFDELVFEEVVLGTGREDGNANRTGGPSRRTAHIEDAGLQQPCAATRALVIRFWWARRDPAQFIHGVRNEIAAVRGVSSRSKAGASAVRTLVVDGVPP
jgi:hypothetical protein